MRRVRGVAAFAALWIGCSSGSHVWDARALESSYPALAEVSGHRLFESPPYFAPGSGGVALILCRWATGSPIPVWLPSTATPAEVLVLGRALSAWETAGLGVRFQVRSWRDTPPREGIVLELFDADASDGPVGTASTIADCAIPREVARDSSQGPDSPVEAELQYASIHLRRAFPNGVGRSVPLSETELLGATLHELGHALGFPGHVARGDSVMSAHGQIDSVRRWGRRVEAGKRLNAPTLAALYSVPSGARVGWLPLDPTQVAPLADLVNRAEAAGLEGPWTRASEKSARLLFRNNKGESYAAVILNWREAQHQPAHFKIRLNRRARQLTATQ